jgi:ribose/xylose/arabinose/galactoside ABC-type transport system permease subunit
MGVLNNGMSIMGISSNVQQVVKGLVLLAAVAFDAISKNKLPFNLPRFGKKALEGQHSAEM